MKEKGFTLIELLAVIVILAIIALIAIPMVSKIIKDSEENAILRSADFYLDAVKLSITERQSERKKVPDNTYEIMDNGNICLGNLDKNTNECDDEMIVNVKGEIPTSGTITLVDTEISSVFFSYGDETIGKYKKGNLAYIITRVSFEKDSWETIVTNVRAGNLSKYNVGDTKEISLTGFTNTENEEGTYTIRIANTSTPDECNIEGFS